MPPLGAHTSIAGGVFQAIRIGAEIKADVVQIFSKNQMQWKARWYRPEELERYFDIIHKTGIRPVTIHTAYLINLASPDATTAQRSFDALVDELKRAEVLQVPYLVMHPGAHMGQGEAMGIQVVARQLRRALDVAAVDGVTILLECTAGQGTNLGYRFEHLRDIMAASGCDDRLGVCLDTCHLFAAGYDLRTVESWNATFEAFNEVVGRHTLRAFHLNDSLKPFGSRRDRHARIGQGELGISAFRVLLNDARLKDIPMILEIPGGNHAYAEDLQILRGLIEERSIP
ncbi:MAG: deoxyribonuclease IV [Calditrichaeota bacterium]|nr:deoxyribonuclease IV [Calditrichota bacterium]